MLGLPAIASFSSSAQLRLKSDLQSIKNNPAQDFSAFLLSDDNLYVCEALMIGPEGTLLEGGFYKLMLTFGEDYPEKPPHVRFSTAMFHPNIYPDGTVSMDSIQDAWLASHNVSTLLKSVRSLLVDPNPNLASPANPEAAQMFQDDIENYKKCVARCENPLKNRLNDEVK